MLILYNKNKQKRLPILQGRELLFQYADLEDHLAYILHALWKASI